MLSNQFPPSIDCISEKEAKAIHVQEEARKWLRKWILRGAILLVFVGIFLTKGCLDGWSYMFCWPSKVKLIELPKNESFETQKRRMENMLCCKFEHSDPCQTKIHFLIHYSHILRRKRLSKLTPSEMKLSYQGSYVNFTRYTSGFFRTPDELHLTFASGTKAVFCCNQLKLCDTKKSCGCNYDCNGEYERTK